MYRKQHNGQPSIEEFHLPFGGTLDPENRWVLLSALMPWEELEETYSPQFSPTVGPPAKHVRLAFGALFIKQRLGLTDEETVLIHGTETSISMAFLVMCAEKILRLLRLFFVLILAWFYSRIRLCAPYAMLRELF